MSKILFSPSLDSLHEKDLIPLSATLRDVVDWVECSDYEADTFYFNPMQEGKRRKKGKLELEDLPAFEETNQNKIDNVEARQTSRMIRQAILGDKESIEMLKSIEDEIKELR